MNNCCDAKMILKQQKLKVTKQRTLLLETIIQSEKVFSALSLQEKVQNGMCTVCQSFTTINRPLSLR